MDLDAKIQAFDRFIQTVQPLLPMLQKLAADPEMAAEMLGDVQSGADAAKNLAAAVEELSARVASLESHPALAGTLAAHRAGTLQHAVQLEEHVHQAPEADAAAVASNLQQ